GRLLRRRLHRLALALRPRGRPRAAAGAGVRDGDGLDRDRGLHAPPAHRDRPRRDLEPGRAAPPDASLRAGTDEAPIHGVAPANGRPVRITDESFASSNVLRWTAPGRAVIRSLRTSVPASCSLGAVRWK